ncbi:MAG: hypothetical protein K0U98_06635 [Deltaproteobacteria bacterium]|nr:hypothetical protein [Deltaproteobacteria bacterium]
MPRERNFYLALASLIALGTVFGSMHQGHQEIQRTLLLQPTPQSQTVRQWSPMQFTEVDFATSDPAWELSRGGSVDSGSASLGESVFVLDWGQPAVRRLPSGGLLAATYLGPLAPGGDLTMPAIDFAVGSSGEMAAIFALEPGMRLFRPDGELDRFVPVDSKPLRVVLLGADRWATLTAVGENLFALYDYEGTEIRKFGRLVDGPFQDRVLLDGCIAADGGGGFVYASNYLGLLAAYTGEGELRYLVGTINGVSEELPTILQDSKGTRRLRPGTLRPLLAVHVNQGKIFLLSERENQRARKRILDIYRSDDGRYLESVRLPNRPRDAFFAGDFLYTVHARQVRRWLPSPTFPDLALGRETTAAEPRLAHREE